MVNSERQGSQWLEIKRKTAGRPELVYVSRFAVLPLSVSALKFGASVLRSNPPASKVFVFVALALTRLTRARVSSILHNTTSQSSTELTIRTVSNRLLLFC